MDSVGRIEVIPLTEFLQDLIYNHQMIGGCERYLNEHIRRITYKS